MSRFILPGSRLNEIAGSSIRYPGWKVYIWNPRCVTINQVASGAAPEPPEDLTPFIETVDYSENIGFENGDDPTTPQATFNFRRNPNPGKNIRRGWIEDGVIVQIRQGDLRIDPKDWTPIFTGTFRGRPGDNPGIPADASEGLQATAYGREERFLNLSVTTDKFPKDIDLGDMLVAIAQRHMGLGQDEILIGSQGFESKHLTNQIVENPALQTLWELLFPVGKKPKFDSMGRLVAVDVNLDKPATRIYSDGNTLIMSKVANPNDVEVNNSVVLRGLEHNLSRIVQEQQLLTEFEAITGFFDDSYEEQIYYSQDRSQRAEATFLVTKKKIIWSSADWSESDEFSGTVSIDTHYLADARTIIFVTYVASEVFVALLDYLMQTFGTSVSNFIIIPPSTTVATLREIIHVIAVLALAGLIWAMQFVGRGKYEVHGHPFEYVYRELVSRHQLTGLEPEQVRETEFRNDFVSDMVTLDLLAEEHLRRELVKDQLFTITLMDDPAIEVDDVIETAEGDRFYVVSVKKELRREGRPTMTLTCWQIASGKTAPIEALELAHGA